MRGRAELFALQSGVMPFHPLSASQRISPWNGRIGESVLLAQMGLFRRPLRSMYSS